MAETLGCLSGFEIHRSAQGCAGRWSEPPAPVGAHLECPTSLSLCFDSRGWCPDSKQVGAASGMAPQGSQRRWHGNVGLLSPVLHWWQLDSALQERKWRLQGFCQDSEGCWHGRCAKRLWCVVQLDLRVAGAHAYLVKVKSITRLLRHVQHIRDQVLGNSSVPLKMMGTDYATDFDEECRKYVSSPPTIQQAHDLYATQNPTRYWGLNERFTGRKPDVHGNTSVFSPVSTEAGLLALFAVLVLAFAGSRRMLPRDLRFWSWSGRSAEFLVAEWAHFTLLGYYNPL